MAANAMAATTAMNELKLVQLNENDVNDVMHYLMKHFIPSEPSARALRMSSSDAWTMTEAAVRASLKSPYSLAFKNTNGEIAAVRIASIIERPKTKEMDNKGDGVFSSLKKKDKCCGGQSQDMPASAAEMTRLLSALESRTWDLVPPSTTKLLVIQIISTHEQYRGRGLMRKLLTADLEQQKRDGINGAISEATAYSSQALFFKLGFRVLYEIRHDQWLDQDGKQIFKCDDQTNSAQLVHLLYQ